MKIIKVKQFFFTSSSDLLSAGDKRLALSNVIGIGASKAGNCSGLVVKGFNYLWKQSMVGELSLAKEYPLIKKGVSPWAALGANGAAWTLSLLQEKYTSAAGWGMALVPTTISSATVAADSIKKLKACFSQLWIRPNDAIQGIAVHAFNLGYEIREMLSSWNDQGMGDWKRRAETFEGDGKEGLRFAHEFSNVGLKIACDVERSQKSLEKYREHWTEIKNNFRKTLHQNKNFAAAIKKADLDALVWKSPPPDLTWQDYFAAQQEFDTAISEMQLDWLQFWKAWKNDFQLGFKRWIDKISQDTLERVESMDFKELIDLKEMKQHCNHTIHLAGWVSRQLEKSDLNYFSLVKLKKSIEAFSKKIAKDCETGLIDLNREVWMRKINGPHNRWTRELSSLSNEESIFSIPFEALPNWKIKERNRIQAICSLVKKNIGIFFKGKSEKRHRRDRKEL